MSTCEIKKDEEENMEIEGQCSSHDDVPRFPSTVETDFVGLDVSGMTETETPSPNSSYGVQARLMGPIRSISISDVSTTSSDIKIYDLGGDLCTKSDEENLLFSSKELDEESSIDEDISFEEESIDKFSCSENSADRYPGEDKGEENKQDDTPTKSHLSTPTELDGRSGNEAQDPPKRNSHLRCYCCLPSENQYPPISRTLLGLFIFVAITAGISVIIVLS